MSSNMQQATAHSSQTGALALGFQEAFTVAARLRANRQSATDAASFRTHVKALLGAADQEARARGYDPEFVKLAVYAYIAFLDETVLNSSQAMFAEWTRQPLQEEIFGEHMAGENFFRYVADLVNRQDSPGLADLLEVYLLCLQLGYRGKYSASDPGSMQGLMMSIQQKIQRIRGPESAQPALWPFPANEVVVAAKDPLIRTLGLAVVGMLLFGLVLRGFLWLQQRSAVADLTSQLTGGG
jgi:type VI secretion system protein ImpK